MSLTAARADSIRSGPIPVVTSYPFSSKCLDTGPGVDEDKTDSLFRQRFTTKRKGHGYGLVTCNKIVRAHRGRIGYESEPESTFFCEIPLHHIAGDESTVDERQAPARAEA